MRIRVGGAALGLEGPTRASPFVSDGQHMKLRTLGAFGVSFALISVPARAQEEGDAAEKKAEPAEPAKAEAPPAEAKPAAATAELSAVGVAARLPLAPH